MERVASGCRRGASSVGSKKMRLLLIVTVCHREPSTVGRHLAISYLPQSCVMTKKGDESPRLSLVMGLCSCPPPTSASPWAAALVLPSALAAAPLTTDTNSIPGDPSRKFSNWWTQNLPSTHSAGFIPNSTHAGFSNLAQRRRSGIGITGETRRTRCSTRSSSGSATEMFFSSGTQGRRNRGSGCDIGGNWSILPRRRNPPSAWGNGERGGSERRRGGAGRRSGDSLVVVDFGSGETELYSWTETDTEVEVRVRLPPGTSAKSVQLAVTKTTLTLGLRGREGPVIHGNLVGEVKPDLSNWTMEEMEETGEKMLYLRLEKVLHAESGLGDDWVGVLEGEVQTNSYYPQEDQSFDVDEYVRRLGYDPVRDADKVDKTMFSGLTAGMKEKLVWSLPKSGYTEKDDVILVTPEPEASPVKDNGVLGVGSPRPSFDPTAKVMDDPVATAALESEAVGKERSVGNETSAGTTSSIKSEATAGKRSSFENEASAGKTSSVKSEASAGKRSSLENEASAGKTSSVKHTASAGKGSGEERKNDKSEGGSGDAAASGSGLTEEQREISEQLRGTYEAMLEGGFLEQEYNDDGSPYYPNMDELAIQFERDMDSGMFEDVDFSDEELSKYSSTVPVDDDDRAA